MVSDRGKRNKKVWHIPRRTKIDGKPSENFGTAMIVQMAKQIVEYILIRTNVVDNSQKGQTDGVVLEHFFQR